MLRNYTILNKNSFLFDKITLKKGDRVSKNKRSATVRMEEGYMQLSIDYTDKTDRSVICDIIGDVEHELDLYPEVAHKRDKEGGTFTVEFSDEVYIHSRIPGEFVEKVLHKLGIEHCEED